MNTNGIPLVAGDVARSVNTGVDEGQSVSAAELSKALELCSAFSLFCTQPLPQVVDDARVSTKR